MGKTNIVWQDTLLKIMGEYDYVAAPRGMEVREIINGSYKVPMVNPIITLPSRKMNYNFMFAEAAWIVSGSNRLSDLTPYMKRYADFSDDGVFLRGAYGPKVIDQMPYVVDSLVKDRDTRQAVLTIWRERPGPSKDIPCTVAMQFLIRNNTLHMIVTMRSQDAVLGFSYDVFTFTMVAKAIQCLLFERGIEVDMGDLHVNAGSLHVYEQHYDKVLNEWVQDDETDTEVLSYMLHLNQTKNYEDLIGLLWNYAETYGDDHS